MSKTCPTCHQSVTDEKFAELSKPKRDRKVTEPSTVRIVRPGHIFMKTKGGQAVEVPNRLLEHRSTVLATMSVEEWKAAVEAARGPKETPAGPSSVDVARSMKEKVSSEAQRKRAQAQAQGQAQG